MCLKLQKKEQKKKRGKKYGKLINLAISYLPWFIQTETTIGSVNDL